MLILIYFRGFRDISTVKFSWKIIGDFLLFVIFIVLIYYIVFRLFY